MGALRREGSIPFMARGQVAALKVEAGSEEGTFCASRAYFKAFAVATDGSPWVRAFLCSRFHRRVKSVARHTNQFTN